MNRVHALDGLTRTLGGGEVVADVDSLDDENVVFQFHVAGHVGGEILEADLARCQRACQRARQSGTRRRDDVVERGGMRLVRGW